MKRKYAGIFFLSLFLLGLPVQGITGVACAEEADNLKAAFIAAFAKFIEWPRVESRPGNDIVICSLGSGPMNAPLESIAGQETQKGRLQVKANLSAPSSQCHILFIHASQMDQAEAILKAVRRKSVLTVSDGEAFASRGGMIGFFPGKDKIHFEVNLDAVQAEGIKINSRMLALAKIYKPSVLQDGK